MLEALNVIMEFIASFLFLSVVVAFGYGSYLFAKDEQADWEARRDYDAMKHEIEKGKKNDSSRERNT